MFGLNLPNGFSPLFPRPFSCSLRNPNAIDLLQRTVQQVVVLNNNQRHRTAPLAANSASMSSHGEHSSSSSSARVTRRQTAAAGGSRRRGGENGETGDRDSSPSAASAESASDLLHRHRRQQQQQQVRPTSGEESMAGGNEHPPQPDDEYAIVTDPLNDRFYIERLFNRRKTLLDLSHRLFVYNTADDAHRRECNNFVLNCPFMRDGPHRPIRLSLAASTLLLALTENGFVVERRPRANNSSSFLPPLGSKEELDLTACATYVACRFCRASLVNVHLLNLVLAHRTDVLFSLLQRNGRMMRRGTPLSTIDLYALYNEQTNLSVRAKLSKFLRRVHRQNCVYLDRAFNQELVFDAMSANRMLNAQLANRCETCLISLIEHDVNCSLQLEDILSTCSDDGTGESGGESTGESRDRSDEATTTRTEEETNTSGSEVMAENDQDGESTEGSLLACKCCLTKPARVNVPCGHLFQCLSCEKLLRRTNQTPFKNAPCPVCRSPVLLTSEIFL